MPKRHFIVCVDCAANLAEDKWKPLSDIYQCEIVGSSELALMMITTRSTDAIVVTCPIAATNLVMQLGLLRRETPIVLLEDNKVSRCSSGKIDLPVERVPDVASLLVFLHERLATPGKFPVVLQRYDIGQLHWPFSVLADRSEKVVAYEGQTVALGKGGMQGKVAGTLHLGETVLIEFSNTPEEPPRRAEVRSRHNNVYGLKFENNRL